MLTKLLIGLGLILLPFYETILHMLPYVSVISDDTREPRIMISLMLALAIGLSVVFSKGLKPFSNKFLLILLVFMLFSYRLAPKIAIEFNGVDSTNFWFWKPFAQALCFFLMFMGIYSADFNRKDINLALTVINWCGVAMAGYVVLQWLGFEQFWMRKPVEVIGTVLNPNLSGSLGQPTICAPFIASISLIAMACRKYWQSAIMVFAVLLIKSDMSLIALAFAASVMALIFFRRKAFYCLFAALLIASFGGYFYITKESSLKSFLSNAASGRLEVWKSVLHDVRNNPVDEKVDIDYSFTGNGLGGYAYIFPSKNNTGFRQVHNDYLEFFYGCGIVGSFLLLSFLFKEINSAFIWVVKIAKQRLFFDSFCIGLFCAIICLLVNGSGNFIFQHGVYQFYFVLMLAALINWKERYTDCDLIKGGVNA